MVATTQNRASLHARFLRAGVRDIRASLDILGITSEALEEGLQTIEAVAEDLEEVATRASSDATGGSE